ncbi:UNVERIFIED_CONTAM: hypothetical protein FKN15_067832 [Acipenser sinensis]
MQRRLASGCAESPVFSGDSEGSIALALALPWVREENIGEHTDKCHFPLSIVRNISYGTGTSREDLISLLNQSVASTSKSPLLSPVGEASTVQAAQSGSDSPDIIVKSPIHASSASNADINFCKQFKLQSWGLINISLTLNATPYLSVLLH